MNNYFGGLVEFKNDKEFEDFLENIKYEDATKLIETVIVYTVKSGLFNLDESFLLYKCLQKIKNNDEIQKA